MIRDIALVATAYIGWKLIKKTKYIRLEDIPIEEVLEQIVPEPEEEVSKQKWLKWISWLWD
jgi:amino acid transporter